MRVLCSNHYHANLDHFSSFAGEKIEGTKAGLKAWLPRRALVARAPPQAQPLPLSLASAQAPKISPQSGIKSLSKGDNQSFHSS